MERQEEKTLLATLREMEVGEKIDFPASRSSYVKSACTSFGFEWNKRFSTSNDRERRVVTVTRTK